MAKRTNNAIDGTGDIPAGALERKRRDIRAASLLSKVDLTETTDWLATLEDDEPAAGQLLLFNGGKDERTENDSRP